VAEVFAAREVLGEIVVVLEGSRSSVRGRRRGHSRCAAPSSSNEGASVRDAVAHVEEALGVAHRVAYVLASGSRGDHGDSQ
jgi:hypothetical protein